MLQRAASNAYSWWWASHIRTTQSKWLDANLQDMENRVKVMLKLLGEEADSFGKRAEMYYRTRPEVISHVKQVYRAYRALVERYDHISKELHKANHTIATACPEQVAEYAMLHEEDDDFPKAITPIDSHEMRRSTVDEILKRGRQLPSARPNKARSAPPPHTSREEADQQISRLQKAILVLQTEKEFVKSSYEAAIARYWEIEEQIADTQEEICQIQDEFDAHAAIHDDEARALMTVAALRSCQATVSKLVHDFEDSIRTAAMELVKTKSLRAQLHAINGNTDIPSIEAATACTDTSVNTRVILEILELQPAYEKIDHFFANCSESSVQKVAENVDELVDKITNLELKFPKQSAQIKRLNQENESIKNKLDELQDEMALRDDPSDFSEQLRLLDDELNIVRSLERSIVEEEVSVSTAFYEIFSCITNVSKALESFGTQDPYALSTAVGDDATVSTDVDLKYLTGENTPMEGGGHRDIDPQNITDNLGRDSENILEVVNHNGMDRIHGSKNGSEEEVPLDNCSMQQVRHEESITSDSNINPFTILENGDAADHSDMGNADSPSEETFQSSSGGTNKTWDMGNDGSENFAQGKNLKGEYPLRMGSETCLLHLGGIDTLGKEYISNEERSPIEASEILVEVAEGSLAGRNNMQFLKNIGGVYSSTANSVITEGRIGDGKSQNICGQIDLVASSSNSCKEKDPLEDSQLPEAACFSGEGKRFVLWHTNEAKSAEEFPKQGGQLDDSQNIDSLNKCGQIESPKDGCFLLDHVDNIQYEDIKNMVSVDGCYSEARDETSPCVPAGDSEETEGLHQQASEAPEDVLENVVSDISQSQLEKKSLNGKELASEETTLCGHGVRPRCENSTSITEGCVSSWQELLLDGLEGREAILLADYTSILRNYKETKRRLAELEKKNQEHLEESKAVIRELRNANSMKYVEIQSLRNLMDSEMPPSKAGSKTTCFSSMRSFREIDRSNGTLDRDISIVDETNFSNIEVTNNMSPFEVKFRSEIDALVEENLRFLVRYSMTCHQMQEFDRRYQEVHNKMEDVEDKKTGETEPAEKKLRELRTELDVWFEQNALLGQEVQLKSTSLCRLQEEIAEALGGSSEMDGARFTPYEAAKFQGEVLNMQQSNSKIESELQAAFERVRGIQDKVNDALRELCASFELSSRRLPRPGIESGYEKQFKHFPSRTRVPLRNFLFGAKRKKKSIFACMNPTLQKQFSDL